MHVSSNAFISNDDVLYVLYVQKNSTYCQRARYMPRKKNRFVKARARGCWRPPSGALNPDIARAINNRFHAECGSTRAKRLSNCATDISPLTAKSHTKPHAQLMYSVHTRMLDLVRSDYFPGLIIRASLLLSLGQYMEWVVWVKISIEYVTSHTILIICLRTKELHYVSC